MGIIGIDGMSAKEIGAEIRNGGRFVIFLWTISIVIVSIKQPTGIHFIRADEKRRSNLPSSFSPSP